MKINITTVLAVISLVVIGIGTYAHQAMYASVSTKHSCVIQLQTTNITAQASYVYDIQTGEVLYAKNEEAQLPLASLTKITTALVVSDKLDASKSISIGRDALTTEGDSGLFEGEVWKIGDLLDFTLVTSSNDGARALALSASNHSIDEFINLMNNFVKQVGTKQTFFLNETGLDVSSTTAGAYGSARDMALLLEHAYNKNPDVLIGSTQAEGVYTSLSGFEHSAKHTSSVAGNIPGELIIKTGFTDLAGGNLVVLSEIFPGRPVAFVVLGADRETRDSDIQLLVASTKQALKRVTLCDKLK